MTTHADAAVRPYQATDFEALSDLWTIINRELAPPEMRTTFERYTQSIIANELTRLEELFAPARGNCFWVVETGDAIVGCVGIERRDAQTAELRRMYLTPRLRGCGLAQRILTVAEESARTFGYQRMILSTAEIQKAALRFYQKAGYRHVHVETSDAMSVKTVGAGLARHHFEKRL